MSDKKKKKVIRRKPLIPWQGPHVTSAVMTIVADGIGLLFASLSLANKHKIRECVAIQCFLSVSLFRAHSLINK